MSLKIKNETVYVIYHNGEPYQGNGRKLVYTTKGSANGVITQDAKDEARYRFEKSKVGNDWYELSLSERDKLIDKVKEEFQVIEYAPRKVK